MEHRLQQNQSLQQTLTPQMQQSLQILQAPTLELQHLIQQELDANPVLEVDSMEMSLDAGEAAPESDFEEEFARLSQLDDDWRDLAAQQRVRNSQDPDAEERGRFVMESLVGVQTLQEHLLEQLLTEPVENQLREDARLLIGNLDERGFLNSSLEDLCDNQGIPLPRLQAAQELLFSFDPPGVGAANLRECLLVQMRRKGWEKQLVYRIVDEQLDNLASRRYPVIAKNLGVSVDAIAHAAGLIATLDPRPGQQFTDATPSYVTPDVVVAKENGVFVVNLIEDHLPRLRISNLYKDIMASDEGSDVRSYIKEKIRSGKFLIRTIVQRQQTIRSIAEEIVKRQLPFFEQGSEKLQPMTMAQVADVVGVHETTVSRTVNGKYMATPHGVFEMKYFFRSGFTTDTGKAMSNTSVKETIANLIRAEDHSHPLSDEDLKKKLEEDGIKIARRTIAKYREGLGILPSHLRRDY